MDYNAVLQSETTLTRANRIASLPREILRNSICDAIAEAHTDGYLEGLLKSERMPPNQRPESLDWDLIPVGSREAFDIIARTTLPFLTDRGRHGMSCFLRERNPQRKRRWHVGSFDGRSTAEPEWQFEDFHGFFPHPYMFMEALISPLVKLGLLSSFPRRGAGRALEVSHIGCKTWRKRHACSPASWESEDDAYVSSGSFRLLPCPETPGQ